MDPKGASSQQWYALGGYVQALHTPRTPRPRYGLIAAMFHELVQPTVPGLTAPVVQVLRNALRRVIAKSVTLRIMTCGVSL